MVAARILIVDDHALVLESIRQLLDPYYTIVGSLEETDKLIERARDLRPDVVLLDAHMPGKSAFTAAKELKCELPAVKVIFVTMLMEAIAISEAVRAGASGYVLKHAAAEELHKAIEQVLTSRRFFLSSQITGDVRDAIEEKWIKPRGYTSHLTARQREVLMLLANGASIKHIAQTLQISMKTVQFHKARITDKLGIHTTSELTKFALERGITEHLGKMV